VENKDKSNTKAKTGTKRGTVKRSKEIDSIVGKITERNPSNGSAASSAMNQSSEPNIIVPPDMQKAHEYVVKPTYFVKQNTVTTKASQVFESVKGKTEEAVKALTGATGTGIKTTDSDLTGEPLIIPVLDQKFSTDKKQL
jgi:hypothetical protein